MNPQNIFSVLLRGYLLCFLKNPAEIERVTVTDQIGDLRNREIFIRKEIFGFINAQTGQILHRGDMVFFPEKMGEIVLAQTAKVRHLLYRPCLGIVLVQFENQTVQSKICV